MKIIKNKRKNLFSNISIPELFIVKYMKEMPEEAIKLYIYLIYLETNQINIDIDQIAKDINLSLKEVKASFEYMQEKGAGGHYDQDFDISFMIFDVTNDKYR